MIKLLILFMTTTLAFSNDFFDDVFDVNNNKKVTVQNKEQKQKTKIIRKMENKKQIKKTIKIEKEKKKIKNKGYFEIKESGVKIYPYKDVFKVAKKENKKVLVIVGSNKCPHYAKLLERMRKKDYWFNDYLKRFFITTVLDIKDIDKYPQFQTSTTPTLYFLDSNGVMIANPIIGLPDETEYFRMYMLGLGYLDTNQKK